MKLQPPPAELDPPIPAAAARRAYVLMLLSSVAFATMTACAREAGRNTGDWRFTALARSAVVLLFAAVVAKSAGVRLVWRGNRTLWVRSVTGSVSMLMTFFALTRHPNVSTVMTLTNSTPLWVTLLVWPLLGQRPTLGALVALASGIAGVALIEGAGQEAFRWTSAAALAAAGCTAVVFVGLHRLKNVDPLAIVVHFSAVATLTCAGYVLVTSLAGRPIDFSPLREPRNLALLAGIGVFGTTGQVFMTTAFRTGAPQRLAVIGLTQVVFALGFDYVLWEHPIHGWALAGIALVVAPVAWLMLRRPRRAA